MNNGLTPEVIKQFDSISKLPETWDHNQHYQKKLLTFLQNSHIALDVGCGTGEYTRELTKKCKKVIGIDVSQEMIDKAKSLTINDNVEYICIDVESFLNQTSIVFDFITNIAVLHHLDEKNVLKLMKKSLSKNGVIAILDLYKSETLIDYMYSIVAMIINPFMMLIKRGRLWVTKEERDAWKDHFIYDQYKSIKEIKQISESIIGKSIVKRHLFWRYSLIYINC